MVIDEFLAGIDIACDSMKKQIANIGDAMEKSSNKILLHIEAKNAPNDTAAVGKAYNVSRETEESLYKILEQFQTMMQLRDAGNTQNYTQLDGCLAYRQRVEYLGSSVRKFMALYNTIGQIKLNLQQHSHDVSEPEESEQEEVDEHFL